jgi:hypothetical protein
MEQYQDRQTRGGLTKLITANAPRIRSRGAQKGLRVSPLLVHKKTQRSKSSIRQQRGLLTAFPTEKASSRCPETQRQTHSGRGGSQGVGLGKGLCAPRPVGAAAF